MKKKVNFSVIEYILVYVTFGLILLFQYDTDFRRQEVLLFIELIGAYIWTMGLLIFAKIQFNMHFFEPIVFITAIYEGIFIVKPIVDLHNGTMYIHGISVIDGGPKATLLFTIGYTIFFFSYYLNHKKIKANTDNKKKNLQANVNLGKSDYNATVLYIAWMFTYAMCILCMKTQGLSIRYIFTFGASGERDIDSDRIALLFLSNFGITLVTLWLMIIIKTRNIIPKIITTALCLVYILMRNSRWLMLIFIAAPIEYYCLKKRKEPSLTLVFIVGVCVLTVFAWMQANRTTLNNGGAMQGWGADGLTLKLLLAPFESDLSTYKTFYSMVTRYPEKYNYLLGSSYIYFFILFIPRILWAEKPGNPYREIIVNSLNEEARIKGTAVSNLGEFYANFGLWGIIIFMYLIGWITSIIKKAIFTEDLTEDIEKKDKKMIMYSIMHPLLFQWIARGNTCGNLYLTIFAFLPYIVEKLLHKITLKPR